MTRYWRIVLALALITTVLFIVRAPARLLPLLVDPQPLRLSALDGTLWRGQASRALVDTPAGPLHLGAVRWQLRLWSLLSLSPRLDISTDWGPQRLSASLIRRNDAVLLRDARLTLDARLSRQFAPVDLRGRFDVELESLQFVGGELRQAKGQVVWQEAAWMGIGGVKPLGTFAARLATADDGAIVADLQTLAGPLLVSGYAALQSPEYELDLQLTSRESMDPELQQALSLVASPGENGYRLRLDGELAVTSR